MENASKKNNPSKREELYKKQLVESETIVRKITEYFRNEAKKG